MLLAAFLAVDVTLTKNAGGEANPLWRPLVQAYGLDVLWLLTFVALGVFYAAVRLFGPLARRFDGYENGESVVLTSIVLAFGTYVLYLAFLLPRFGYFGTRSHYALIPVLIVPVLLYHLWIKRQLRVQKPKA